LLTGLICGVERGRISILLQASLLGREAVFHVLLTGLAVELKEAVSLFVDGPHCGIERERILFCCQASLRGGKRPYFFLVLRDFAAGGKRPYFHIAYNLTAK
jgi:hypothetical protein